MKCPICGNKMEPGFIQSGYAMLWAEKPHKVRLYPCNENEVALIRDPNPFRIQTPAIPAKICKKCKKVLLDYSELDII